MREILKRNSYHFILPLCQIRGQVGRAFTLLKDPIRTMVDLVLAIRSGHYEGMAAQGGP
jgi:hypothetical protein